MRACVIHFSVGVAALFGALRAPACAGEWKAGAAKIAITPDELMWMSGYGGRDHPAEGKLHDLWAKALAMEDPSGARSLVLTADLVGISRPLCDQICDAITRKLGIDRDRIMLCMSHTHTGPVVGTNLLAMWDLAPEEAEKVDRYAATLRDKMLHVAEEAVGKLEPARLAWGSGTASFAVNRRNNPEAKVPELRAAGELKGPVDHDVPVLRVTAPDGTLKAVVFGYACHNTVLAFYQWSGDYAGFAQLHIEAAHPSAVALFFSGCGADQNPLPRRSVELADDYGRQLAEAVERVLESSMHPVTSGLAARFSRIDLPFDTLPTRDEIERTAESGTPQERRRAKLLLSQIDQNGALSPTYPYPVQVWRLGDLTWVVLGGEVVVDYSLRLKKELGGARAWVTAYANDVMAYIPSRRVLDEGGYEGGGAMLYYGLPTKWGPTVEERIVAAVHELAGQTAEGRGPSRE